MKQETKGRVIHFLSMGLITFGTMAGVVVFGLFAKVIWILFLIGFKLI